MMPSDEVPPVYMLSIDVEDWFHAERLSTVIGRDLWDSQELRVVANLEKILTLLRAHRTRATFFVLGWVAERMPQLVRWIHEAGHEVASHGYDHQNLRSVAKDDLEKDIQRSSDLLASITGEEPIGYRSPRFSVAGGLPEILRARGFRYDSSLYPASVTPQYGRTEVRSVRQGLCIGEFSNGMLEVPIATLAVVGTRIPWGGGGYFRFYPYWLFRQGFRLSARQLGASLFYTHPWEVDPGQPRVQGLRWIDRTLHFGFLGVAERKLDRLLSDFHFVSIAEGLEALDLL